MKREENMSIKLHMCVWGNNIFESQSCNHLYNQELQMHSGLYIASGIISLATFLGWLLYARKNNAVLFAMFRKHKPSALLTQ